MNGPHTDLTIVAMIPARMGSERLRMKNLAMIAGRPMISYAIEAARSSCVFAKVVVNSENVKFKTIADRHGVDFYLRPAALGSSDTRSDDVVRDFMKHRPADIVAWVNPTSPLQTGEEIKDVVDYFLKENLDTLITVKNEQVHAVFDGKPVNFSPEGTFAKTQDLRPVQICVYSVMMWRSKTFQAAYDRLGYAMLSGKVGYYPVGRLSAVIIKKDEDLLMADWIVKGMNERKDRAIQYDDLADVQGNSGG